MERTDRTGVAIAAWLGALIVAIGVFTWLGDGRLGTPALTDPTAWPSWVAAGDPVEVAMSLARLLVLALAWYLVGVTTLGIVARSARSLRLLTVADALTIPSVRRLLQASLGLGLATAAVASSTAQVAGVRVPPVAGGPGVVAAAASDASPSDPGPDPDPDLAPDPRATPTPDPLWFLDEAPTDGADEEQEARPPAATTAPRTDPAAPDDAAPTAPAVFATDAASDPAEATWVVERGDHFWSIAERVVGDRLGRAASDAEVDPYWRLLIAANQDRLANPGDPDLILPGQRFLLPAVGA